MASLMLDNRKENFMEELNYGLLKNYGTRLTINDVKEEKGKFRVFFNYNKVFNVIDDTNKKVFVRNIFFENVYSLGLSSSSQLKVPIHEVNRAIDNQFVDLRDNLFHKVISNKNVVIRILKKIHPTSFFLSKFYTILTDLVYSDVLDKKAVEHYLKSGKKNQKYIDLIIDSQLAEFDSEGRLKATSKFKKLLEENKKDPSTAVEEAIFKLIKDHYDYIVYELGLRHIKAYINVVSSLYYLQNIKGLSKVSVKIPEAHKIYEMLFGSTNFMDFRQRINLLVLSGIFSRSDNSIALASG